MFKETKIWPFLILFTVQSFSVAQEFYKVENANVEFFSSAPLEDIQAVSGNGISVINSRTGEISFSVDMRSFKFKKALMQEHFNEEFVESHKYPKATFKGNIRDYVDLSTTGDHDVLLQGTLEVHGKSRKRQIPAHLKVGNGNIELYSKFEVACKDHDIKIPKILWKNIAEVVQVEIKANYSKLEK